MYFVKLIHGYDSPLFLHFSPKIPLVGIPREGTQQTYQLLDAFFKGKGHKKIIATKKCAVMILGIIFPHRQAQIPSPM
jgi:hypothetical protein